MRTLVDIPDQHIKALNQMSKERKVSRASLVREAVDAYLEKNSKARIRAVREAAFGIWKDRDIDGLDYQRKIREEWER